MQLIRHELEHLFLSLAAICLIVALFYPMARLAVRRYDHSAALRNPLTAYLAKHPLMHFFIMYSACFLGQSVAQDISVLASHSSLHKYLFPLVFSIALVVPQRLWWRLVAQGSKRAA